MSDGADILDLTDRDAVNEAAARLVGIPAMPTWACGCGATGPEPSDGIQIECPVCGLPVAHRPAPDFLAGWDDEAQVNGDLLWKVWCALSREEFAVRLDDAEGYVDCEITNADGETFYVEDGEQTAHPVAAMLLAAGHAGLLEEKP